MADDNKELKYIITADGSQAAAENAKVAASAGQLKTAVEGASTATKDAAPEIDKTADATKNLSDAAEKTAQSAESGGEAMETMHRAARGLRGEVGGELYHALHQLSEGGFIGGIFAIGLAFNYVQEQAAKLRKQVEQDNEIWRTAMEERAQAIRESVTALKEFQNEITAIDTRAQSAAGWLRQMAQEAEKTKSFDEQKAAAQRDLDLARADANTDPIKREQARFEAIEKYEHAILESHKAALVEQLRLQIEALNKAREEAAKADASAAGFVDPATKYAVAEAEAKGRKGIAENDIAAEGGEQAIREKIAKETRIRKDAEADAANASVNGSILDRPFIAINEQKAKDAAREAARLQGLLDARDSSTTNLGVIEEDKKTYAAELEKARADAKAAHEEAARLQAQVSESARTTATEMGRENTLFGAGETVRATEEANRERAEHKRLMTEALAKVRELEKRIDDMTSELLKAESSRNPNALGELLARAHAANIQAYQELLTNLQNQEASWKRIAAANRTN